MKRRFFVKGLGIMSSLPSLPKMGFATTSAAIATTSASTVSADIYIRAEALVRAQKTCNLAMVEHLLQLDSLTAKAVRQQLLANGIISSFKTQRGMHIIMAPIRSALASSHRTLSETIRNRFKRAEFIVDQAELLQHKPQKPMEELRAEDALNKEEAVAISDERQESEDLALPNPKPVAATNRQPATQSTKQT